VLVAEARPVKDELARDVGCAQPNPTLRFSVPAEQVLADVQPVSEQGCPLVEGCPMLVERRTIEDELAADVRSDQPYLAVGGKAVPAEHVPVDAQPTGDERHVVSPVILGVRTRSKGNPGEIERPAPSGEGSGVKD
jgi:hypothetical protein